MKKKSTRDHEASAANPASAAGVPENAEAPIADAHIQSVAIADLVCDPGLRGRMRLWEDAVRRYTKAMRCGDVFLTGHEGRQLSSFTVVSTFGDDKP